MGRPGAVSSSLSSARMKRTRSLPADKQRYRMSLRVVVTSKSTTGKLIVANLDVGAPKHQYAFLSVKPRNNVRSTMNKSKASVQLRT